MKWFLKVLRQYADFSGRASRQEFWMFILFNTLFSWAYIIVVTLFTYLLANVFQLFSFEKDIPDFLAKLALLYYCVILIPSMAVGVRRLHDTGKSGWMMLVNLIPLIGGIWLLVLFIMEGNPESNVYGSAPEQTVNSYKVPLQQKALCWLIIFSFYSIILKILDIQHMVERGILDNSGALFYFSFNYLSSFLLNIAFIIMGITLWNKKDYSRSIAVWLFVGVISSLGFQIHVLTGAGNTSLFQSMLWMLCLLAFICYAGFLFIRKGKEPIALYVLMGGSVCWIIQYLLQFYGVSQLPHAREIFQPGYFITMLLIIIPVAMFIYGLESYRKEKDAG